MYKSYKKNVENSQTRAIFSIVWVTSEASWPRSGHLHDIQTRALFSILNGVLSKKKNNKKWAKSAEICDFGAHRSGRGLGRSWGGLWRGLGGSAAVACSTAKNFANFFFAPRKRPILESGASWPRSGQPWRAKRAGREAAILTSGASHCNVLSTV